MHNPLKSEAVAFRWLMAVVLGGACVVIATVVISSLAGALVGLALVVAGAVYVARLSRGAERGEVHVTRGGDGRHRVLVLANQTVRNPFLRNQVLAVTDGRRSEIRIVVPALARTKADFWASDTDEAAELARQRMELAVIEFREGGRKAEGVVGDSDPRIALQDALAEFAADEIYISTLPEGKSKWLDQDLVETVKAEVNLPVKHLVWDPEA